MPFCGQIANNLFVVTATSTATTTFITSAGAGYAASSTATLSCGNAQTFFIQQQQLAQLQELQLVYGGLGSMCNPQPPQANDEPVRMVNQARSLLPSEASNRARELLLARLTPEQRETFESNNWFVVTGGRSGRRYRIRNTGSLVANVELMGELPGGGVVHRLCGHIAGEYSCPLEDHLLGQKLLIEHDEDQFLRVANIHR